FDKVIPTIHSAQAEDTATASTQVQEVNASASQPEQTTQHEDSHAHNSSLAGIGSTITDEQYEAARVPAFIKKGKALAEHIKNAKSTNAVYDILEYIIGIDILRHCARFLGVDVDSIKPDALLVKAIILRKANFISFAPEMFRPLVLVAFGNYKMTFADMVQEAIRLYGMIIGREDE
ncbi:MAG: hypothetical protein II877_03495, partial [Synergistaceae bacterium]|nr:hypothetical protein [Synergistaceae bacterium]